MEFLLELLLTAVVALLFSFLVAKLVSLSMERNDQGEKTEIGVGGGSVTVEEVGFGLKMDAPVVQSERKVRVVVDENVEHVDDRSDRVVVDELEEEAGKGENLVLESLAAVSLENVVDKEMIVCGEEETSGEREELIGSTVEAESSASVSLEHVVEEEIMNQRAEGRSVCEENVERGEGEEVKVEESNSVEKSEDKMELKAEEENEEEEELSVEEDDDWEGIERSELEKVFAAASNLLEESGKGEDMGAEAKMELYGLHKIATEGSCREAQPMAVMVSARAKWNAWHKLGNMSQEEAMEQYLILVSKEIPGLLNTPGKMLKTETSTVSPPNSEESTTLKTTLDTTSVASSKNVSGER